MLYSVYFLGLAFMVSVVGVSVNPLPQYATGALVLAAGFSCASLAWIGGSFMSIILFLIYLGGMLVVFAYSVALSSGPYLVKGVSWPVGMRLVGFLCVILYMVDVWGVGYGSGWYDYKGLGEFGGPVLGCGEVQVDLCGVSLLYSWGGIGLFLCVFCLFICLFVVLGLTRGAGRGVSRPF
uniref:NADH-ubiquinone oxidoreductase chain 6 n=1 Tax=Amphisbaena schmidti TaxID=273519 RepID=Q66SU7_AMPSC|nr:NADH dehydrogenase subunit 6 [Amphisbaena schmidti]AAT08527.1 NADH dehydrogenase subunit 6 [Amphisbaena schmidti]